MSYFLSSVECIFIYGSTDWWKKLRRVQVQLKLSYPRFYQCPITFEANNFWKHSWNLLSLYIYLPTFACVSVFLLFASFDAWNSLNSSPKISSKYVCGGLQSTFLQAILWILMRFSITLALKLFLATGISGFPCRSSKNLRNPSLLLKSCFAVSWGLSLCIFSQFQRF